MNLKNLTDAQLLESTKRSVEYETEATLVVLHHLREVERRQLFSEKYSSLHEYCEDELGYDKGSAHLRVTAMQLLRELPEYEKKFETGELNLTLLCDAKTFMNKEKFREPEKMREVIETISGMSTRDAKIELISRSSEPEKHLPERVRQVSKTHSEIRIVVDEDTLEQIQQLQALLAHAIPGASIKDVLKYAVEETLKRKTPKTPVHAHEPKTEAEIYRIVWHRDGGRCTHTSPDGRRCNSNYFVQHDHIIPVAKGGLTTVENLRLLCRTHNRRAAIVAFGHQKIAQYVPAMRP